MAKKYQLKVESSETVAFEPVVEEILVEKELEHVVAAGDTWASLGARFKPKGVTTHEHAKLLHVKNNGCVLRAGVVVKL